MRNKHSLEIRFLLLRGSFALNIAIFFAAQLPAQTLIDGYVFETNNITYLNQVKVTVFKLPENIIRGALETGPDGHFVFDLPPGQYRVLAYKDGFFEKNGTVKLGKETVFLKMDLRRQLEHTQKSKAPPPKRVGEANLSVPLPELKPPPDDLTERGETAAPAPAPRQISDPKTARPSSCNGGDTKVRILPLPPRFKGYAVELERSTTDLPATNTAFRGQKEVFRLLENDGKFSYLIANLGPKDAATSFFKKKIKPFNKTAKLVLYSEGGKEYLPE